MAEVPEMSSRQRWTLVLVCTAAFMLLLDITVAAAAFAALGAITGFAYGPDPARQPPPSPAPGDHGELSAQPAPAHSHTAPVVTIVPVGSCD